MEVHSDGNIRWLSNYLFAFDFSQLQSWVFSQGPLAFLQFPLPIENNRLWAYFSLGALRIIILYALVGDNGLRGAALVWGALVYLAVVQIAGHHQIFLLTIMALLYKDSINNQLWHKALLILILGLIWQIRLVPALAALSLLGVYFLSAKKNWMWLFPTGLSLILSDVLFLQNLALVQTKWQGIAFLFLNSNSLAEYGKPQLILPLTVVVLFTVPLLFILKRKSLPWLSLIALLVYYYLSRPDLGPLLVLIKISVLTLLLTAPVVNPKNWASIGTSFAAVLLIITTLKLYHPFAPLMQKWKPFEAWQETFSPKGPKEEMLFRLGSLKLEPERGLQSVQVYPGHYLGYTKLGDALITGPVPQGYYILNTTLDSLQANSLVSGLRPKTVYVHKDPISGEMMVNGQSLWHQAPRYFKTLLEHYYLASSQEGHMTFRARETKATWQEVKRHFSGGDELNLNLKSTAYSYRIRGLKTLKAESLKLDGVPFLLAEANISGGAQIWPLSFDFNMPLPEKIQVEGDSLSLIVERIPLYENPSRY